MTGEHRPGSDRDAIVVLGGYGAVGRAASEALAGWFPGRAVVAGRDGGKARRLAGAPRPAQVDVTRPDDVRRVLDGARLVVMCVEQANAAVGCARLERGVHYVEISATTPILAAVAELDGLATARGRHGRSQRRSGPRRHEPARPAVSRPLADRSADRPHAAGESVGCDGEVTGEPLEAAVSSRR